LLQSGSGSFTEDKELPIALSKTVKGGNGRKYTFNLPSEWSLELGQLMGWMLGDGFIRVNDNEKEGWVGLAFGNERTDAIKYFKELLSKYYGKSVGVRKPNSRSQQIWIHSKFFADWFIQLGLLPVSSLNKRVPYNLFSAPKVGVIGFLQGLFSADGTVGYVESKSAYIRLPSKSRYLLADVQLLLLNLGIKARIYNRSRAGRSNLFPDYISKDGITKKYSSDGVLWELEISKDGVLNFLDEIGFMFGMNKEKINKLRSKNYYSTRFDDRVVSVKPVGKARVYDLTEPITHSFIANGMVVSNCGEIPLLPYESCNLTSLCLQNHVKQKAKGDWEIDWDDLEYSVKVGVRFLDNMIEVNTYALEEIRQMVKEGNRRIGLGVMGFAHLLYKLGIPYNSKKAVLLASQIAKFMRKKAEEASMELAKERGTFGHFDVSIFAGTAEQYRNCALMMIAPTGTTSLIADTSSGIEPVFSLVTVRRSFNEDNKKNAPTREFTITDPMFEAYLKQRFDAKTQKKILEQILKDGHLDKVKEIPKKDKKVFITTHQIEPEWHVQIQAAWQKWIDNSVSKTINFPHEATVEDVKKSYLMGWKLGLKGITIYRDGSKMDQVLNVKGKESKTSKDVQHGVHATKPATGDKEVCPECGAAAQFSDGCISCQQCGWSKCTM
jgi:ribonucleoside-diphosphate reductase alpha chain